MASTPRVPAADPCDLRALRRRVRGQLVHTTLTATVLAVVFGALAAWAPQLVEPEPTVIHGVVARP